MKRVEQPHTTTDLGTCVALQAAGLEAEFHRSNGRRVVFHFQNADRAKALEQMFWKEELQVDALSFFVAMKNTKSRIHAMLNDI